MMSWSTRDFGSMSAFLFVTLLAAATPLPAAAQEVHAFSIVAQDPASAIRAFGAQAQIQILASADDLKGKQFNPVSGDIPTEEALNNMLKGTGLDHRYVGERAIALMNDGNPKTPSLPAAIRSPSDMARNILLAQSGSPPQVSTAQSTSETNATARADENRIDEVLVTAQKKSERLQDVPVPLTVVGARELVDNGQVRLQDYYDQVPGLNLTVDNRGSPTVSIRGISTGIFNNPTVGITVDDVPYGSATRAAFSWAAANIDPNELKQIEVLRGPQGSLYGASSIGGLIKYVTVDPSVEPLKGYLQTGMNAVQNGSGLGYNVGAGINLPLTDSFAIRASGFTRNSSGYIDDPVLHLDGLNSEHGAGGRLAALWQPSKDISLKLSALYQKSESDGSQYVDLEPGLNGLEQSYVRGSGRYDRDIQAYSATLKARVGAVDITSISGYGINSSTGTFDVTNVFGPFTQDQFGVPGTLTADDFSTRKFTQEIRLAAPIGERLAGLLGVFYTHERSDIRQGILAAEPDTGALIGTWLAERQPVTYKEYAVFGDLTIRLTDRFDVQIGGRESRNQQSFSEIDTGPLLTVLGGLPEGSSSITPKTTSQDSSFTYLVTPRFKFSPNVMVYARFASGYRPGGPNSGAAALGAPGSFDPDKTLNYELGFKADMLDRALTLDASVYDIKWINLQVQVVDGQTAAQYTANAGSARSRGIELSMESRPVKGLTVDGWISWDEATLTQDMPTTSTVLGSAGERLPYSARFSGHLSAEQAFPVAARATGFVGVAVSYVGSREGEFASSSLSPLRQRYPDYTTVDLKSGLRCEAWKFNLYANNVTDRRGVLAGGLNSNNPNAFLFIQPRTVGLSVSYTF